MNNKKYLLSVILFLLPPLATAAPSKLTANSWLSLIPPVPTDANQAAKMWQYNCKSMKEQHGPAWKKFDNALKQYKNAVAASVMGNQGNQQMAQMAQQFANPAMAEKMQHMSQAQIMAMAQRMQQQYMGTTSMGATALSPQDAKIMDQFNQNTQIQNQVRIKESDFNSNKFLPLMQQWDADNDAIAEKASQADGSPKVRLQFDKQQIALANQNLHKSEKLYIELIKIIKPLLDSSDKTQAAWKQLSNPALKQRLATQADPALNGILGQEITMVAGFVDQLSQKAADAVSDYNRDQRLMAGKTGNDCPPGR